MNNIPKVKVGIVAVSRDCFPESLSVNRRKALVKSYAEKYASDDIYLSVCLMKILKVSLTIHIRIHLWDFTAETPVHQNLPHAL